MKKQSDSIITLALKVTEDIKRLDVKHRTIVSTTDSDHNCLYSGEVIIAPAGHFLILLEDAQKLTELIIESKDE